MTLSFPMIWRPRMLIQLTNDSVDDRPGFGFAHVSSLCGWSNEVSLKSQTITADEEIEMINTEADQTSYKPLVGGSHLLLFSQSIRPGLVCCFRIL